MKKITLFLFAVAIAPFLKAQSSNAQADSLMAAVIREAAKQHPSSWFPGNTHPPVIQFPSSASHTIDSFNRFRKAWVPANSSKPITIPARLTVACEDTSYSRLYGVTNGVIYILSVSPVADGGMLVCAEFYDSTRLLPHPSWKLFGLLIRFSEAGQILWQQQFEETTGAQIGGAQILRAFELAGGDIICTGVFDTTSSQNTSKTMVYRLSASGSLIWKNCLKNTISTVNAPTGFHYTNIESATEGLSGDVILGGTTNSTLSSSAKFETIIRLNSAGQLVWDANYGNNGDYQYGAEGMGVYMDGGNIAFIGLTHGASSPQIPAAITLLKIDYATGNLISKRFYRPQYTNLSEEFHKTFSYWYNKSDRLLNGHYIISGKLFSDFMGDTPIKDHFGVVEVDESFNLVDAYTISSPYQSNYYNSLLRIDQSGGGMVSLLHSLGYYDGNVFFSNFRNKQFIKERMKEYRNIGLPGNNGFIRLRDGGYAYLQTYFEDGLLAKSYYEFRKMHDSDTSSLCLGKDSALLRILPLNIVEDPNYYYFDANRPNLFEQSNPPISISDTLGYTIRNLCLQTNHCDTVSIHGNPVICGTDTYLDFTAFKRSTCGAAVLWQIDNYAVDSMKVLNDTTIRIWFKNINWQGNLYASLPAPACFTAPVDSIRISVIRSQTPLSLGPDKVLCTGNSLVLHAGSTYNTYLWQDGSTDSLYTVAAPGLYWVSVSDACGNNYRDTVLVTALDVSFTIGPDRVRCNTDTIHLDGPSGYISYQWSPNYAISNTTGQHTVVSPAVDTIYILKAEKLSGCFASDTIRILAKTSPPVFLGIDTSFCQGDSLILDAGSGFSSYNWNTGATTRQIAAFSAGRYSVIATTASGCRSYDTLQVLQVYPLPAISLDHTSLLCQDGVRVLAPGTFSSYLWQDGSTGPTYTITGPGLYHVQVTGANQCKAADTVLITGFKPAPRQFLPPDTAICNYGSITIRPLASFTSYHWNTGLTSPTLTTSQPGTYWLTVIDYQGCAGTDSIMIRPKDCIKGFYMPTGFTPNNDGRNDILRPFIGGIVKEYQLIIYNRWGQVVFASSDPLKGWDGKLNGVLQDGFVFVWSCHFRLEGEESRIEKGTVLLIR